MEPLQSDLMIAELVKRNHAVSVELGRCSVHIKAKVSEVLERLTAAEVFKPLWDYRLAWLGSEEFGSFWMQHDRDYRGF